MLNTFFCRVHPIEISKAIWWLPIPKSRTFHSATLYKLELQRLTSIALGFICNWTGIYVFSPLLCKMKSLPTIASAKISPFLSQLSLRHKWCCVFISPPNIILWYDLRWSKKHLCGWWAWMYGYYNKIQCYYFYSTYILDLGLQI
jgi:hypothetical protein